MVVVLLLRMMKIVETGVRREIFCCTYWGVIGVWMVVSGKEVARRCWRAVTWLDWNDGVPTSTRWNISEPRIVGFLNRKLVV